MRLQMRQMRPTWLASKGVRPPSERGLSTSAGCDSGNPPAAPRQHETHCQTDVHIGQRPKPLSKTLQWPLAETMPSIVREASRAGKRRKRRMGGTLRCNGKKQRVSSSIRVAASNNNLA
eukprot:8297316-Pyramimonas_sp.AAC.1